MRVLVVGSGAREHALGWKLAQSPSVTEVASLPGNPGLAALGPVVSDVAMDDVEAVADHAGDVTYDLVVVGPEGPLAAGLVDALAERRVPGFGPTRSAARLESSKGFAHEILRSAGVPAAGHSVYGEPGGAHAYLDGHDGPYVVKADGLAAGKGVLVTESRAEAQAWVDRCFSGGFGEAGRTVVIEEHLEGEELSVFALCGPGGAVSLGSARDHKRLLANDEGPNTGGMGAFAPVPGHETTQGLLRSAIEPVLGELAAREIPFAGFLFAGFMLTEAGPKVLEFNVRMGDPEAQVLLPRLQSDLAEALMTSLAGEQPSISWHDLAAVDVVLAAPGYPEAPVKGHQLFGVAEAGQLDGVEIFHAGTAVEDGRLVTDGGRVLSVVGTGTELPSAAAAAYQAVAMIQSEGLQYRPDIAGGIP